MPSELEKLRIHKSERASRNERSSWPWILLVLLLGGGTVAYWQWKKSTAPTPVDVLHIHMPAGAIDDHNLVALQATGYIMAAHRIELASKVVGRVAWIGVEMGDKIDKDQVLVRLEDDEYKARVMQQQGQLDNAKARLAELKAGTRPEEIAQAQAQFDRARVEFESADRTYQRLLKLRDVTNITQNELDDAESLMRSRKAQMESVRQQYELAKNGTRAEQIAAQEATVHQIEGGLKMSQLDLDNTVIRAPVKSTILERNVEVGEFVTNGFVGDRGAKGYVVSIADLSDLLVELDINQNDFAKVSGEQPCWVTTDAYPDRRYDGVVERISPMANRQKATVLVRVKILSPDDLLKPDMNASVSFLSPKVLAATRAATQTPSTPTDRPLLHVPRDAVHDGAVFIIDQGKAVRRLVAVGEPVGADDIQIKKGLKEGDDLILHPPATLKENDPVTLTPANR